MSIITELIKELSLSVEQIIGKDWNPKDINSNELKSEYQYLVPIVTFSTIEHFKESDLALALFKLESEISGVTPNQERCHWIAKKLTKTRNTIHAKIIYKGRRERRDKMNIAIKEIAIPFLRKLGFKGSFPKLKLNKDNLEVIVQFQFSQFSSQFVVEIKSSTLGKGTLRLGSIKNQRDYWFDFEDNNSIIDIYKFRAQEIIDNWEEVENWLNEK